MKRAQVASCFAVAVSSAIAIAGCDSGDASAPGPKEQVTVSPAPLVVTSVTWNAAARDLGRIDGVADSASRVAIFGAGGATLLENGSIVTANTSVKEWKAGAIVPAAAESWIAGVSKEGRVLRMRSSGELEDVTGRWGLEDVKVQEVSALANGAAVFRFEGGFAMSKEGKVVRYPLDARAVASNAETAVVAGASSVCFTKVPLEPATCVPFEGATFVAAATDGPLVASAKAIHRWKDQEGFTAIHDAGSGMIHGMATSGARVWIAIGRELALYEAGSIRITTNAPIDENATLVGSLSGDVWVLANGALTRFGATSEPVDERVWRETVQPINARVCGSCHGPPGSGRDLARIDLSTYAAWAERRAILRERVIDLAGKPRAMPPPSSGFDLSEAERTAIDAWSKTP